MYQRFMYRGDIKIVKGIVTTKNSSIKNVLHFIPRLNLVLRFVIIIVNVVFGSA